MKVVNGTQMRKIDKNSIENFGIPGIILMEHAGLAVAEEVLRILENKENKEVVIICGQGNNGGDGFVAARHLWQRSIPVKVFIMGNPLNLWGDAKTNYNIIEKLSISKMSIAKEEDIFILSQQIERCGLVVDAILGTGLKREVAGMEKQVIEAINHSNKTILSIDIPSGVNADDGTIMGAAVKADKTVVLELPKIGNINYPGADYNGEMIIKEICIPDKAIEGIDIHLNIITKDMVKGILPVRKKDTHKGDYGKVYIVAGSTGMTGAAMLTSEAALRSGAGLLKVAIPQSLNSIMEVRLTEAITIPLPEMKKGAVGISDIDKIIKTMEKMDVVAIGPGSGQNRELEEVVRNIIDNANKPIVLDADALNALSNRPEVFELFKTPIIMTPHVREMARLTGLDTDYISKHRIEVACKYAKIWNAIVILKGARTVVASPEGKIYINMTGNPGMATAGSGDVLTGIITGFIAQGIEPMQASIAAVYVHGAAGDRSAQRLGEYGIMAGDMIKDIPLAIKDLVGR